MTAVKNGLDVVSIRLVKEPALYSEKRICCPDDAIDVIRNELKELDREVFCVLNLKTNNQPINFNVVSMGTLNASLISPREVFKSSVLSNANGFIAFHNHPSGNCQPSNEDIEVTKRLIRAGDLLDIQLLDHIIVGGDRTYSFLENMNHLWDKRERKASLDSMMSEAAQQLDEEAKGKVGRSMEARPGRGMVGPDLEQIHGDEGMSL